MFKMNFKRNTSKKFKDDSDSNNDKDASSAEKPLEIDDSDLYPYLYHMFSNH